MTALSLQRRLRSVDPVRRSGRVRKIFPTYIEADGPNVALGTLCMVQARVADGPGRILAEVVRLDQDSIILSPLEGSGPVLPGALVTASSETANTVPVGHALLGRAVDALARPLDLLGPIGAVEFHPLHAAATSPLDRSSPTDIFATGIRAVDGLLTLGKGQRVGIFAASGVGKTVLMNQIARQADADIVIICLVGERGREVDATWNQGLDVDARRRTTLVAAISDQSAAIRVRAAHYALALAEYWRDKGKHVLLLLDSVTRLAMAMREIGLAAGEPPTVRGYTPSVFATIPKMVERCGARKSGGAITAVLTVLSETDDVDDPICEMAKSLLDGHVVLSRALAEQGHYPAIDIPRSISRQAAGLVNDLHRGQVLQILEWLSLHQSSRTLIDTGLYVKGSNAAIDRAVERHPQITRFSRQAQDECTGFMQILATLNQLVGAA